jgi:hypothetical protein
LPILVSSSERRAPKLTRLTILMPFPNEIAEINLSSGQDGGQEISKIAILDEPRGYLACPARFERATYALEEFVAVQKSNKFSDLHVKNGTV